MPRLPIARALPLPVRLALRQVPALGLAALLVVLLSGRLSTVDPGAVTAALGGLSALQWLAGGACAALSFWAIGHYDALVHCHLATGRGPHEARRAGLVAIAISQFAGFGLLTGALVRLRMLPGLGLGAAVRLSLTVALLFLTGWAVVTALAFLVLPGPALARIVALGVLAAVPAFVALLLLAPRLLGRARALKLPTLGTMGRLTGLAAVDTLAAGLCLAVLLPPEAALPLAVLLPAFLLAFGVGLVSGTPGGIGAFEVTFLALLPFVAAEPMLAGILAWRVVYYVAPALIALVFLARGPAMAARAPRAPQPMIAGLPLPSWVEAMLALAPRAEAGILRQGDKLFLSVTGTTGPGGAVLARTGQAMVLFGDPLGSAKPSEALAALTRVARAEGRAPCLYKSGAALAIAARQAGWKLAPVAVEAWLRPAEFKLDAPERSQLRRKLRKAETSGLEITLARQPLPLAEMAEISDRWVMARGGERGFSMGRFAPIYVAAQRIYLARLQGRTVGFLTLHTAEGEWTTDLMRLLPEAPDGTMHALVANAIADAAELGCPRLSLAALPHARLTELEARLPGWARPKGGPGGLGQFKLAFAPRQEVLYIAAPSWAAMILAGFDISRAISEPCTLAPSETEGAATDDTDPGWEGAPA